MTINKVRVQQHVRKAVPLYALARRSQRQSVLLHHLANYGVPLASAAAGDARADSLVAASAFTLIFECICCGVCPCNLSKSLIFSKAPPDAPSPCLRRARFLAPVEPPAAEAPAAEPPVVETPAADRPLPTSSTLFRLRVGLAADVAPSIGSTNNPSNRRALRDGA